MTCHIKCTVPQGKGYLTIDRGLEVRGSSSLLARHRRRSSVPWLPLWVSTKTEDPFPGPFSRTLFLKTTKRDKQIEMETLCCWRKEKINEVATVAVSRVESGEWRVSSSLLEEDCSFFFSPSIFLSLLINSWNYYSLWHSYSFNEVILCMRVAFEYRKFN